MLFFLFIPSKVQAQQFVLTPGTTTISVASILLSYFPDGRLFYLEASPPYLLVEWNAIYSDGLDRSIGSICFVNCPYDPNDPALLEEQCKGLPNCTYIGPPGKRFCVIESNQYNWEYDSINNVTCRLYDPSISQIDFRSPSNTYPNQTFRLISYQVLTSPYLKLRVGDSITLPVRIVYDGIIKAHINISVNSSNPNAVFTSQLSNSTSQLYYGDSDTVYSKVFILNAIPNTKITITTSPFEYSLPPDSIPCTGNQECVKYFGTDAVCDQGRCWRLDSVDIDIKYASLNEIENYQLIFSIIISSVLLFSLLKRNKRI